MRAAEQAKELLGKLSNRELNHHPSRGRENDQGELESDEEERIIYPLIETERIIYPLIETGTGFKDDIQSNTVPCLARTTGTRLEDILPDKVPRSDPCNINSHALTNKNEATGHVLTKGLVQAGQRISNKKVTWPKDLQGAIKEKCQKHSV